MLDNRYIVFATVAELGNITKTANRLGYTQSGVSQQIQSLENECGFRLLNRSRSGVTLTKEGELILHYVKQLLDADQNIRMASEDILNLTTGSISIGCFTSLAVTMMPEIIREFSDLYPGIEVKVFNRNYSFIEGLLYEDKIDCAFVALPSRDDFLINELMHDQLMVILHKDHPLASSANISTAQFQHLPYILSGEAHRYIRGKVLSLEDINANVQYDLRDDFACVAMVRQNLGVTVVPELMLPSLNMDNLVAVPLEGSHRIIGIATHPSRYTAPPVRAFLRFIRSRFED